MSISYKVFFIVFILSFLLGLVACERKEAAGTSAQSSAGTSDKAAATVESGKEKVGAQMEKAEEYMDDSMVTAKVKTDILGDPLLGDSEISVTTTNGVVKLSGVVDSQEIADRSKEVALSVKGVKSVESELAVKGAP